jgi:hypothetical protein
MQARAARPLPPSPVRPARASGAAGGSVWSAAVSTDARPVKVQLNAGIRAGCASAAVRSALEGRAGALGSWDDAAPAHRREHLSARLLRADFRALSGRRTQMRLHAWRPRILAGIPAPAAVLVDERDSASAGGTDLPEGAAPPQPAAAPWVDRDIVVLRALLWRCLLGVVGSIVAEGR